MQALLAFIGGLFLSAGLPVPEREHYVEVPYSGLADLKVLVERGLDVGGINLEKGTVTLVVKEGGLRQVSDLRIVSKREIRTPDSQFKKPADVEKALKDTEGSYPHLARVEVIGKTEDGQDLYAINLTARFVIPNTPKKTVLFDAMHHAREVMTTEVALDIVDYLTKNYETDEKVQKWMNQYSIWVVPMMNPDGNSRVWNQDSMWRKNGKGGYGVDVNRNYPYAWNACNGSSGSKSSETYRGPSAGSEMETQAITALASRIKPMIAVSYHSFSEIVIYPFGCSPKKIPAPDADTYLTVGKELAKTLVRDSGSGSYKAGTSYELLYDVDGGSVDWMYSQLKTMAFVIEINGDSLGFQPSYSKWRDVTVQRQRAGWQYVLDRMSGPGLNR
jgi:carboxypeptidase T